MPISTEGPSADRDREIALHQAAWAERAIDSYTVSITRACFCPPGAIGPYVITVVDGSATEVLFEGAPADPSLVGTAFPLTIDAVFERLRNLEPRATMTATWDPDWGFPTSVSVDPIPNAIDDEYSISIAAFAPAD
ncbi:MAG TPA: DUF6174 domain-containing protein [Candidatus Limnocylindrales bacterium]|nr:DUF6174 domain-containing protein [Candidatus Limnocylindrales bacterium]